MADDYVVREEDIDLMHDIRVDMSLEDLIDCKIAELVQLGEQYVRELQKLIDFILSGHTHAEIVCYANELRLKLKEVEP
jgi:hypothetical protein